MKPLRVILLLLAAIGGLAAAFQTGHLAFKTDPPVQQPPVEMIDVIVAKKDLPVGTVLKDAELENCLTTIKWRKELVPPDAVCNAEDLKNKRLNRTLKTGNYFSSSDVVEDSDVKLPDGMYQYAIRTNASATTFQPGDHVDVICTETLSIGDVKSNVVLRDLLVLAVDAATRREPPYSICCAVSLAVAPEQCLILATCQKRGDLTLLLRGPKSSQP